MTPLGNKLGDYSAGKVTLATLLGNNTLWAERYLAGMLMITSLGIPLLRYVEVLIDSAGAKKTLPRTIFPWLLAEDNPVISW